METLDALGSSGVGAIEGISSSLSRLTGVLPYAPCVGGT